MGNLLEAVECTNVVQSVNTGRQSTVQAEYLVVDQGGQGQEVEEIGKEPACCSASARGLTRPDSEGEPYFQTFAFPYLRKHSS